MGVRVRHSAHSLGSSSDSAPAGQRHSASQSERNSLLTSITTPSNVVLVFECSYWLPGGKLSGRANASQPVTRRRRGIRSCGHLSVDAWHKTSIRRNPLGRCASGSAEAARSRHQTAQRRRMRNRIAQSDSALDRRVQAPAIWVNVLVTLLMRVWSSTDMGAPVAVSLTRPPACVDLPGESTG